MLCTVAPLKRLIDEHDVIPEFLNAIPRYIVILSPAEQSKKAAWPEDNDRFYRPLRQTNLQIPHITQLAPIAKIDDLLAPELAKSYKHDLHLIRSLCLRQAVPFRRFSTLFRTLE